MQTTKRSLAPTAAALGLIGLCWSAIAQDTPKAQPAAAKSAGPVTAIVGAEVHTVTQGVIPNGVILIQDGKILQVGKDVTVPPGATVVDAKGKVVTPGYIALNMAGIGLGAGGGGRGGGGRGGGGGGAGGDSSRLVDSLNPFDRNMKIALANGITTGCLEVGGGAGGGRGRGAGPGDGSWDSTTDLSNNADGTGDDTSVCPCCGLPILAPLQPNPPVATADRTARRHAVLKMAFGDVGSMLAKESAAFYHLNAGALTGPLNHYRWRETVRRAKEGLAPDAADAGNQPGGGGRRGGAADDLNRLVKKEIPLRISASSAEQIRDMLALAKELDYNLIIDDAHEAWLVADELAAAKAQAVITPRSRRTPVRGREDTSGSSIETSGKLQKAGVPFAVVALGSSISMDGIAGRDLTSLPLEGAFLVRGGATDETALAALTIVPARMLGVADRLGSIEEGKDADLLILSGQPLDYHTNVEHAIINGKVYYDRVKEPIYPDRIKR